MTQDDVIKLAREASNTPIDHHATPDLFGVNQLKRFAQLVVKAERNRLADELQKMPLNDTANSIAIWIRGQE